jgi:nucleotide-binding universal stress UspA family protein
MEIPLAASTDQDDTSIDLKKQEKDKEIEYVNSIMEKNNVNHTLFASEDILGSAKNLDINLIIIYSHGYTGPENLLLEKEAQEIERHSHIPVLLVRGELMPGTGHGIKGLAVLDDSKLYKTVLPPAAYLIDALSSPAQGELYLFQAVNEHQAPDETKTRLEDIKDELSRQVTPNLQITPIVVQSKDATGALEDYVRLNEAKSEGFDLIAMATDGEGGLRSHFLRSKMTKYVHDNTTLPIFTVQHT